MTVAINGTGAVTGVSPVAMRSAGGTVSFGSSKFDAILIVRA